MNTDFVIILISCVAAIFACGSMVVGAMSYRLQKTTDRRIQMPTHTLIRYHATKTFLKRNRSKVISLDTALYHGHPGNGERRLARSVKIADGICKVEYIILRDGMDIQHHSYGDLILAQNWGGGKLTVEIPVEENQYSRERFETHIWGEFFVGPLISDGNGNESIKLRAPVPTDFYPRSIQ